LDAATDGGTTYGGTRVELKHALLCAIARGVRENPACPLPLLFSDRGGRGFSFAAFAVGAGVGVSDVGPQRV
jgi:hypothetical protein